MPFCSTLRSARAFSSSSLDQLRGFFVSHQTQRFGNLQLARFLATASTARVVKHGTQLLGHLFHARRCHEFMVGEACDPVPVRSPCRLAHLRAISCGISDGYCSSHRRGARRKADITWWRQQCIEHALFRRISGLLAHLGGFCLARFLDSSLDQVANDGLDVAPDVTYLVNLVAST